MIPITANPPIHGAQLWAASGRMGMATRMKPYVPSFRRTAARMTEPTVGAWVWASGSHVWNGNIGTLTANPMNRPAKIHSWVEWTMELEWAARYSIEKLTAPVWKNRARKLSSMRAEPNSVYRKNLIDAY